MNLPKCPKCGSKGSLYYSNEVEFACKSVMRDHVMSVESAGCLRIQRDQLQEHIKRLEQIGDEMRAWCNDKRSCEQWDKIKEDK